jgi:hypothetical protein
VIVREDELYLKVDCKGLMRLVIVREDELYLKVDCKGL